MTTIKLPERNSTLTHNLRSSHKRLLLSCKLTMNLALRLGSRSARFQEITLAQFTKDLTSNWNNLEKAFTILSSLKCLKSSTRKISLSKMTPPLKREWKSKRLIKREARRKSQLLKMTNQKNPRSRKSLSKMEEKQSAFSFKNIQFHLLSSNRMVVLTTIQQIFQPLNTDLVL